MMQWQKQYVPPQTADWQGRTDAAPNTYFFQTIQPLDLNQITPAHHPTFALIGFCCDEGIKRNLGRPGAALAPAAIRKMLALLPMQSNPITCVDAGNITCDDGQLEVAQTALSEAVHLLLKNGYTPLVLGGGHETAYGHFLGISKAMRADDDTSIGIVNFDAHFDLRPLLSENKGSSGTPFLQIATLQKKLNQPFDYYCIGIQQTGNTTALFHTANTFNTKLLFAEDFYRQQANKITRFMDDLITRHTQLYVSICMDVFSQAYAPGVSAPQPLGLTPWQVIPLLRQLAATGKVVSYDVVELSPPFDIDQRTAKLTAALLYEIMHAHHPASNA